MIPGWIRPFLFICAVYDVILGAVFLIAYKAVFEKFGVGLPNHPAYLQFGAAYVVIMGIGFWLAARAPERNRDILKLCLLTKIAYFMIVFGYQIRGMMPGMWVPFAWCDVVMAIGVIAAMRAIPVLGAAAGGAKAAA
jgi:hypothetical protein